MKTILHAKNVQKVYGTKGNQYKALEDIDLEIKEGEFIGIMGPSGAGKSTLLNILSTIDTPTSGEIIIADQNIVTMKEEQLSDFRRNKLADTFEIRKILDKYPYHISGGQKQRTAASRAIVTNPSLILADEPTGALDSKSATDLLESLTALNEQNQSTMAIANDIIKVHDGRIIIHSEVGYGTTIDIQI